MTSPAFPIDPDALMADSAWLRALARGLVRDSSAADDLAQETWIAALRSRRAEGVEQRAWLSGVLRNVAWKKERADRRRSTREAHGARAERLPETDELVARAEMQRSLSEAVLALDEPFRTAILLRYLEDLTSAEIARRQRVPEGTVRWRVMRGLELLRADLERRRGGDWLHSCALVAGLARAPEGAAVATAAGAGILTVKSAMLAAGLAVAGVTAVVSGRLLEAPDAGDTKRTAGGSGAPELTTTNSSSSTDEDPNTSEVGDEGGARATRIRTPLAVRTETETTPVDAPRTNAVNRRIERRTTTRAGSALNTWTDTQSVFLYVASADLAGSSPVTTALDVHAYIDVSGAGGPIELDGEECDELLASLEGRFDSAGVQLLAGSTGVPSEWCSVLPLPGLPVVIPWMSTTHGLALSVLGATREVQQVSFERDWYGVR